MLNYNNQILANIFFIFLILLMNMYNYFEGDRVPNFSILICAFISFFALKSILTEEFTKTINYFISLWNKNIINKYIHIINLDKHIKFFNFIIIIIILNVTLLKNNFILNYFSNNKILLLYISTTNPWYLKFKYILSVTLFYEIQFYKYIILNKYIQIYNNIINLKKRNLLLFII